MKPAFVASFAAGIGPVFAFLCAGILSAQEREDCYCLEHSVYGYVEWGCIDNPEDKTASLCITTGTDGLTVIGVPREGWERLEADQGICRPCMPQIAEADIPIRFRSIFPLADAPDAARGTPMIPAEQPAPDAGTGQ